MREKLKILKIIFFTIVFLIMAGCAGILVCALNPSLTEMLAERVESMNPAQAGSVGSLSDFGNIQQPENSPYGDVQPGINAGWMDSGKVNYEIPGTQPAETPASVSGRNGYEPVREEAEQIAEEEADNLSGTIEQGDTGSGLIFDEEYYPYYAMLEKDMQQLYNQVYANALDLNASFVPVTDVSVEEVKSVFEAVYNDHPELFWLETGYSCKYLQNGSCVEITLKYNDVINYLDQAKADFSAAAQRILTGAAALGSDSEKERYVHDSLMQMVEYDLNAAMSQSAYSALVANRSVCAGYARAFQYLMQQLGIPCYYCTGYAGEDHAWNIIKLDGIYYNVDVTWDDTSTPTYDYYNKSDSEFSGTHVRTSLSIYLPACVSDAGNGTNSGDAGSASIADILGSFSDISDFVNPNPTEPLTWQSKTPTFDTGTTKAVDEAKEANLKKAGITEDQVRSTMKEYYEDCLKLLKEAGVGDKQFSNVVPSSLWNSIESAYSSGDYWSGYVESALKDLGVEHFVINLQLQDLGGGYYRLYHNVYTY